MNLHRLTALVALLAAAMPLGAADLKSVFHSARGSVFLLRTYNFAGLEAGTGTGFAVAPGVVATNQHVVKGAARVEVVPAEGKPMQADAVILSDETNDLALLRVEALRAPSLKIRSTRELETGDWVMVLGNPLGLAGSVSEGIVSAVRPEGLGAESGFYAATPVVQITAPISPGSSGSPVLDSESRVVGVAASSSSEGQNVNFAIAGDAVSRLMRRASKGGSEKRLRVSQLPPHLILYGNLAISVVLFAAIGYFFWRSSRQEAAARAAEEASRPKGVLPPPRSWQRK